MKSSLVLLTVSFPYGKGEQFLESEIVYLAEVFDEITIVPAVLEGTKRPLPPRVNVEDEFAKHYNFFGILLSALKTTDTYREMRVHPEILLSMTKIQRLLSFMGRGSALFQYLKHRFFGVKTLFYSYWFNGSAYALYLLNREKSIHYVVRAHGSDLYLKPNKGYLPFRKPVIDRARAIFCISQDGADYMRNTYAGHTNTRIEVCRLGTQRYTGEKKVFNHPCNQLHLVSCAHISSVKRVDLLVSALGMLGEKNPAHRIFWTHIGSGPLYEEIKTMCRHLPNNVVANLPGHMNNKEILDFYAKNDFELFINTSQSEGIPVSFMEAMSCGIPVMAPAIGGIPEIVNAKNGILLPEEIDVSTVYRELQAVMEHKEKLYQKRIKARETWERMYNAEKNYRNFARNLKTIIGKKA
jgi:glycosyltransferase involved in cell wall biosynthesis